MIDLPPQLPKPFAPPPNVVEKCVSASSAYFAVPVTVIKAIMEVEGGKVGTLSRNKNGTYDIGIMQINTVNLGYVKKRFPKVGWRELAYNPCINIAVGTWMLSEHIKASNQFWIGVGNYHSKTPHYRTIYLRKVAAAYKRQIAKR